MPRKPRIDLPGMPQHIIQRGNNRERCFYASEDYQCYLGALGEALGQYGCHLHSYVLMTNHAHLLVTPIESLGIPLMMQSIGRKYVRYINKKYQRTGTLWEGRYKACLVDGDAWLLTCMRYIEMNPVRAGMVSHPDQYIWSSYAANAHGKANSLLKPHPLYLALGQEAPHRQHEYREFCKVNIDEQETHEIREILNQELVLGRENFKVELARMTQRQVRRGSDGRPPCKPTDS